MSRRADAQSPSAWRHRADRASARAKPVPMEPAHEPSGDGGEGGGDVGRRFVALFNDASDGRARVSIEILLFAATPIRRSPDAEQPGRPPIPDLTQCQSNSVSLGFFGKTLLTNSFFVQFVFYL